MQSTVVLLSNILIYRCGGSIGITFLPMYGIAHRFPISLLLNQTEASQAREPIAEARADNLFFDGFYVKQEY